MITTLVDALFGCWHRNYSFPITAKRSARRSPAAAVTGTYVVCLDCGKEFPYSWQEMKVVSAESGSAGKLAQAAQFAGK
jgi:predicted transcriptional regulator